MADALSAMGKWRIKQGTDKPCIETCIQSLRPITHFMVQRCLKLQVIISSNPKPSLYHLFPILFNGTTINPGKQSYLQSPKKAESNRYQTLETRWHALEVVSAERICHVVLTAAAILAQETNEFWVHYCITDYLIKINLRIA